MCFLNAIHAQEAKTVIYEDDLINRSVTDAGNGGPLLVVDGLKVENIQQLPWRRSRNSHIRKPSPGPWAKLYSTLGSQEIKECGNDKKLGQDYGSFPISRKILFGISIRF